MGKKEGESTQTTVQRKRGDGGKRYPAGEKEGELPAHSAGKKKRKT